MIKYVKELIHIERPIHMFVDGPWKEYAKRYVVNPRNVHGSSRSSRSKQKSPMTSFIFSEEEAGGAEGMIEE